MSIMVDHLTFFNTRFPYIFSSQLLLREAGTQGPHIFSAAVEPSRPSRLRRSVTSPIGPRSSRRFASALKTSMTRRFQSVSQRDSVFPPDDKERMSPRVATLHPLPPVGKWAEPLNDHVNEPSMSDGSRQRRLGTSSAHLFHPVMGGPRFG